MAETESRFLHVTLPGEDDAVIRLDADPDADSVGNVIAGGHSVDGTLLLFRQGSSDTTDLGASAISVRADRMQMRFRRPEAGFPVSMELEGGIGFIRAGGAPGTNAEIRLLGPVPEGEDLDSQAATRIRLQTDTGSGNAAVTVGGPDRAGVVSLRDEAGDDAVVIRSSAPEIVLGNNAIVIRIGELLTPSAEITVGGNNVAGGLRVRDATNDMSVDIRSANARITFWRGGEVSMRLDGGSGNIRCGGSSDQDGDILLYPRGADIDATAEATLHLDGGGGSIRVGTNGHPGQVFVRNTDGDNTVVIDGEAGDIILRNADCAEQFDVDPAEVVDPGTVLVLGSGGLLACTAAYDKRVAGVVSGAGELRPGIVLDGHGGGHRAPVALVGKAYCNVTAEYGAIDVGDLLTTSTYRGFAMRATDPARSSGAILGKALGRLERGRGRVPVLVTLQ